ncbi:MAG: type II secretion system protein, partial [Planctomycetota bacterium]
MSTRSGRSCRGFTLLDLLVSLAVIAVLMSFLLPALESARIGAERVKCATQLREAGIGTMAFAIDSDDKLMPSIWDASEMPRRGPRADQAVYLRVGVVPGRSEQTQWDAMGHLIDGDYVATHELFYCPSHTAEFTFDAYANARKSGEGEIVSNYHYRVDQGYDSRRLSRLNPSMALAADSMRSPEEFNHQVGANVLAADFSTAWFDDEQGEFVSKLSDPYAWF